MGNKRYSPRQARELLGCSKSTLASIAATYGIGEMLGSQRIFSEQDIAALRAKFRGKSGRPRKDN